MARGRGLRESHRRDDGAVTLHELAIRTLVDSDHRICRNGFNAEMRSLMVELEEEDEPMPMDFRPDAYLVDRERKELTIFEVGDWRLATHDKEARLGEFWFWWDCAADDWTVRCFAVNRFGRITHEMDLCGFYLDTFARHMPRFKEALAHRSGARGA